MVRVQDHMVRVLEGCHREEDAGEAAPRRELGGVGAPEKQHLLRVVGLRNRMSSHILARLVPRISDRCGHALRGRRGASASSRTRGGKSRNGLKEIEERKFSQFFCDPNCDQISPNCDKISSQLDPAQIAKKIACNSGPGQVPWPRCRTYLRRRATCPEAALLHVRSIHCHYHSLGLASGSRTYGMHPAPRNVATVSEASSGRGTTVVM